MNRWLRVFIIVLALSLIATLIFFPTFISDTKRHFKKFDHSTPVKIGFGARATQEFPFFHGAAILYRRKTPRLQTEDAFKKWLAANPNKAKQVLDYQKFLDKNNVGSVFPMRELLQGCASNPLKPHLAFDMPPKSTWPNIVPTLKWFKAYVEPEIGEVRIYHGYRNLEANKECGSKSPVHPANTAIDIVPMNEIDPAKIERKMCDVFRKYGRQNRVGMGFYGVGLIHIDTRGFRSWGPDTRSKTSPCPAQ